MSKGGFSKLGKILFLDITIIIQVLVHYTPMQFDTYYCTNYWLSPEQHTHNALCHAPVRDQLQVVMRFPNKTLEKLCSSVTLFTKITYKKICYVKGLKKDSVHVLWFFFQMKDDYCWQETFFLKMKYL